MGGPGSGRKKGSVRGSAVLRKMSGEASIGRTGKNYGSDKSLALRAARAASNDAKSLSNLKAKAPSFIKGEINKAIRDSKHAATRAKSAVKAAKSASKPKRIY